MMMENLHHRMGQIEEASLVHMDNIRTLNARLDDLEARLNEMGENRTETQISSTIVNRQPGYSHVKLPYYNYDVYRNLLHSFYRTKV